MSGVGGEEQIIHTTFFLFKGNRFVFNKVIEQFNLDGAVFMAMEHWLALSCACRVLCAQSLVWTLLGSCYYSQIILHGFLACLALSSSLFLFEARRMVCPL